MILSNRKIIQEIKAGNITFEPFSEDKVNPASINVTMNNLIYTLKQPLDCKVEPEIQDCIECNSDGYILQPNKLYLMHSVETVGSKKYVGWYDGRSSLGRYGICSHNGSQTIDPGFCGAIAFQVSVVEPVRIYPRIRIGQLLFIDVRRTLLDRIHGIIQYKGKYSKHNLISKLHEEL